jgi:hypothetical protein
MTSIGFFSYSAYNFEYEKVEWANGWVFFFKYFIEITTYEFHIISIDFDFT